MPWKATQTEQLQTAVERFDRPFVEQLCTQLIASLRSEEGSISEREGLRVLGMLQRKRYFQLLQRVSDAMIHGGLDLPVVRRRYAQALLDQEFITAGLSVLEDLCAATAGSDPSEYAEARGLIGRAYKQLYVLSGEGAGARPGRYLQQSLDAYNSIYSEDASKLWHGINVVALLGRAAEDGLEPAGFPNPADRGSTVALSILEAIEEKQGLDAWEQAIAMEACLSLGRVDEALERLAGYVDAPGTDAFELGGTLRQLIEVWRLDGEQEPGARMLPLLRAKLLSREGGQITVSPAEVGRPALDRVDHAPNLEKVFGAERFQSLRWFREALERCRAVARIEDEYEEGIGTGFLLEGGALKDSFPQVVMMTNAHVTPEGISPEDAYITFRGLDTAGELERFRVERVLWSSSSKELDATIFVLQTIPPDVTPCPVASKPPPLDNTPPPRAFIVGHPRGGLQPMFSIQDNLMLDYDEVKVHYRAPTEPGSSGSPVFDRYWKLIALHHAGSDQMPKLHGGGTYQANEGIWIGRIKEALDNE